MKYIHTKDSAYKVDDEDYDLVSRYNWHSDLFGYARWRDNPNKASIAMHRLIVDAPKGMVVDHINHDVHDNRKKNLRICTHTQNLQNSRKQQFTTSNYKGVCWHKKNRKWWARISVNKKQISLGYFAIEEEAAKAYNKAAAIHYGEFAVLNNV